MAPRAVCLNVAPRRGHHVLDDREAEPGPARRARRVAAVEALEEPLERLGIDAGPVVGAVSTTNSPARRTERVNVAPWPA